MQCNAELDSTRLTIIYSNGKRVDTRQALTTTEEPIGELFPTRDGVPLIEKILSQSRTAAE